jgi:hypothetical protein
MEEECGNWKPDSDAYCLKLTEVDSGIECTEGFKRKLKIDLYSFGIYDCWQFLDGTMNSLRKSWLRSIAHTGVCTNGGDKL